MALYLPGITYIQVHVHVHVHVACLLACGVLVDLYKNNPYLTLHSEASYMGAGLLFLGVHCLYGRTSTPITMGAMVACSQLPPDKPVTMR